MTRAVLLCGAAMLMTSGFVLAQDAPESLLPPGFQNPAPTPTPKPSPTPTPARTTATPAPTARPSAAITSSPIIQPIPGGSPAPAQSAIEGAVPERTLSLADLERMSPDELDELFGLKPKVDIPPAARRSLENIGIIAEDEGGLSANALVGQPGGIVRAALVGTRGPLVSRWAHILLRRALASRLDAPAGLDPVRFAALRADLLIRMGEGVAARALVQDVDTENYSPTLTGVALNAYLATGDVIGACPMVRLQGGARDNADWQMMQSVCGAYAGEASAAISALRRMRNRGAAPRLDVMLAERFAGAAGRGRQAVTIEWDGVDTLTPWRFGLASALGVAIPDSLFEAGGTPYRNRAATMPMLPVGLRADASDSAGATGILSSEAMVDLYGQIYGDEEVTGGAADRADQLRVAYVAQDADTRLAALRELWGGGADFAEYGRAVLTAFAAARMPVRRAYAADAGQLIAAMLSAGLDRNALRWSAVVPDGSQGWALLALAQPQGGGTVSNGALDDFIDADTSSAKRKSAFLLAGLAGLERIDANDANSRAGDLGISLRRNSPWSRVIDQAAAKRNPALVAMLAGVGMQGDSWDHMTARQLFHIVRALNRSGLDAEARMIAAEAVARG